ncbi:MAG: M20 family metallopeptidase [Myxococcota bacterium]
MSIDEMEAESGWGVDRLVETRRHLHRHPELSGEEHETARYVVEQLAALGLEPELGAHGAPTGVVALIEGSSSGPTLAWRADTDALPIEEESGATYASCRPGVMHACGHDVHTTVGLGIASRLMAARDRLRGRVKMIFQPEEEGVPGDRLAGAEAMAQGGVLESPRVDAIFAAHCMPSIPVGQIGYRHTAMWAGSDHWRLVIRGRQSHGAYPQDGVDPIWIAGQVIVALQGIPARVVDSRQCCVVSVGRVEAGGAFNVIPETATLVGLLRTLDDTVRADAVAAMEQLVEGVCQAWGGDS